MTITLSDRSETALALALNLTGSKNTTDTLNRAVQVYAYLEYVKNNGGRVIVENQDGDETVLEFF